MKNKNTMNKFKWTDDRVFDFVNWYVRLHKLPSRFELENQTVLDSFKRGDLPGDWRIEECDCH